MRDFLRDMAAFTAASIFVAAVVVCLAAMDQTTLDTNTAIVAASERN